MVLPGISYQADCIFEKDWLVGELVEAVKVRKYDFKKTCQMFNYYY